MKRTDEKKNNFLLFGVNKLGCEASGERQRRAPSAASTSQNERVIMHAALISAIDKTPDRSGPVGKLFLW